MARMRDARVEPTPLGCSLVPLEEQPHSGRSMPGENRKSGRTMECKQIRGCYSLCRPCLLAPQAKVPSKFELSMTWILLVIKRGTPFHQVQLCLQGVVPERKPLVWHVGLLDLVALHARLPKRLRNPVHLALVGKEGLQNTVASNFTQVAGGELPHLGRHRVLFHERLLGEVDHQWIVRGQAHIKPPIEKCGERVPVIVQEQVVVAQRRHCKTDLFEVIQVLQARTLPQIDAVGNAVRPHEGRHQVIHVSGFPGVRHELDAVEPPGLTQLIQHV
mmetsp:Transcript_8423/g.52656  ORF Transcript_8423/g.52656 Transcript_8423/m.52656 type:complete len:274 (+) Transcript_8423:4142-4963(+)